MLLMVRVDEQINMDACESRGLVGECVAPWWVAQVSVKV